MNHKALVGEDGRLYCPQCGHELIWDDTQDRGEVNEETGELEDDYTTIDYWHCNYCGVSIDVWQALEGQKGEFPFWQNKNTNNQNSNTQ